MDLLHERLKALSAIKAGSHIHEISKNAKAVEEFLWLNHMGEEYAVPLFKSIAVATCAELAAPVVVAGTVLRYDPAVYELVEDAGKEDGDVLVVKDLGKRVALYLGDSLAPKYKVPKYIAIPVEGGVELFINSLYK